jgi:hypothetical protein
MTIALVSANEDNPAIWLDAMKKTIEHNGIFRYLFPEVRKGTKWDQQRITVTRDEGIGRQVQSSITALSIRSGLASQHFDYLIVDDAVNEQVAQSEIEMQKAVKFYNGLEDILKGWENSKGWLVVGTPWGREDVIAEALKEEEKGTRFKWGIGALGDFEISELLKAREELIPRECFPEVIRKREYPNRTILPTECNEEKLQKIKDTDREQYQLNYLCKPYIDEANGFDLRLFREFAEHPDGRLICACHPDHYHHLRLASVVAVSDPAYTKEKKGCESAILVGAMFPCGCRFLMQDWGGHLQPKDYIERAGLVAAKHRTYMNAYCIEDEALQLALRQWLDESKAKGEFPLTVIIHGLKARNRAKDARISNAQPAVNNGFWHKRPGMNIDEGFLEQLYKWPYSRKRDRADAFAYFEDAWAEFPPRGGRTYDGEPEEDINRRIEARDMEMFEQEQMAW